MSHYKSNLRDIEFNLFELFGLGDKLGTGAFEEMEDGFNSGWITFGRPGAERVAGTITPAQFFAALR